jgi:tRNA1(Val) A37 N6-methylase TrmN6
MTPSLQTSSDAFLGGRLMLEQPMEGFRSGFDAVFLAAACDAKPGESVLEAGCGAGVASLCLCARVPGISAVGVDIDPELVALASRNAAQNGMADRCRFVAGDIGGPLAALEAQGFRRESYTHVIANPPFAIEGRARLSRNARRARACAMPPDGFEMWLRFLAAAAAPHGTCTLIHLPEALPHLLKAWEGRFGGPSILPVAAKAGENAIRVILQGKKGSRAPVELHAPVALKDETGAETAVARAVLREGAGLD